MGNLSNPNSYMRSFWDWEFLNECFRSGIQVSDIDGIVERRGFFLVLETKQPGVQSSKGQRVMLENLVRTGYFTVVYVWGFPEKPEEIEILAPTSWGERSEIKITKSPSSVGHLQDVVRHWFTKANKYPRNYKFDDEIAAEKAAQEAQTVQVKENNEGGLQE